ncbi:MAG: hypothetical protein ACUVWR_03000 [Anaerolineae bacterium]
MAELTSRLDELVEIVCRSSKYRAFPLLSVRGEAGARDIAQSPPTQKADLALVLKTIPCLEQVSKGSGTRLLETIDADYLLVSFPAHSIGGRDKGMAAHYEKGFLQAMHGRPWPVQRFAFASELAFLVWKGRVQLGSLSLSPKRT